MIPSHSGTLFTPPSAQQASVSGEPCLWGSVATAEIQSALPFRNRPSENPDSGIPRCLCKLLLSSEHFSCGGCVSCAWPPPRSTLPISKVFSAQRSPSALLPPGAIALQGRGGGELHPLGRLPGSLISPGTTSRPVDSQLTSFIAECQQSNHVLYVMAIYRKSEQQP